MASESISLIAGLGNPGAEYEMTRHNCGFMTIDRIASELFVNYWKSQGGALVGKGKLDGQEILLVKPQAFMNRSGKPLANVMQLNGIGPESILVIHDDLDLPDATIRFKHKGGHGGHNGIRSICAAIGNEFARLKIGIGRPPGRMDSANYVLEKLSKTAQENLGATVALAAEAAIYAAREGVDAAMLRYHTAS